jgi:primosomal protein N'
VGRSGRAKPGEVIVQTFRPEAPEIVLAAEHMTETYLEQELKLRRTLRYPPYTHMIRLIFRGPHSQKNAQDLYRKIEGRVSLKDDYRVSCSPTLFGGGKVWHIFVRGSNPRTLIQDLNLDDAVVDIDPLDCV